MTSSHNAWQANVPQEDGIRADRSHVDTTIVPEVSPRLDMWGGVECTVNRIDDCYFDQLKRVSHRDRLGDIDRFADLGIRALRFPLLWEHMQPESQTTTSWEWPDQALSLLRQRQVQPILGLLHHGYGPPWTGLLDPEFPEQFARYADLVARRYPWIDAYTPINEPLTTARFSGLYGHWYPHTRDDRIFAKLFLAQCRAIVFAMRAIRTVNPGAQLIQTEDLGNVTSTSLLTYQRDFENERRWLTWDVLHGFVDPSHPMWLYFRSLGISERELADFVESPCPPDVIGVNYYITSDRFLDDRIERYEPTDIGGNGRHRYADVATVHARDAHVYPSGIGGVLRDAWARYRRPMAVTECHIGCTREEQMRWLHETWTTATTLREEGVDVRAITTWALLGSYDWNSLVTRSQGCYESGAFDVRAPVPRQTALAHMVRSLATHETYDAHPIIETPGWWRRETEQTPGSPGHQRSASQTCVLIIGATGTLGQALARICAQRGLSHHLIGRPYVDIADQKAVAQTITYYRPWLVINAAGYVDVDRAEVDRARCIRENTLGPATLAAVCASHDIPLVTYSSDLVFDGHKGTPYVESDMVNPCNVYGQTKATAEQLVLEIAPQSLVIRTSAFFGPWDQHNWVTKALRALQNGETVELPSDLTITPTYVPDLAHATLDLALDGERGIWHLSHGTPLTWPELVCAAAERLGISTASLLTRPAHAMTFVAPRPTNSALSSELGWFMPTLDDALTRYITEGRECLIADVVSPPQAQASMVNDSEQPSALTY